jgi:precorrin-6A/cobalt-precorrin-6A reductase
LVSKGPARGEKAIRALILGGTTEAAWLAEACAAVPELEIITSLAGRTRAPIAPPGVIRIGGFGGADGLERYLREQAIDRLVDATHPFALQIGRNAEQACRMAGVPRLRLLRPPWQRQQGDRWIEVDSLAEAARRLPQPGRVFLSVGRSDLGAFAGLQQWFLVRTIEPVEPCLVNARWLADRGPFRLEEELALLCEHAIDVVVTKASGGEATYPKLAAARQLGLPVIMVRRPPPPSGPLVDSVAAALDWLTHRPADSRPLAGRST